MMTRFSFITILILSLFTISCAKDRLHLLNDSIKNLRPTFGFIVGFEGKNKTGAGSGVLISQDLTNSYVLTAGHVCVGVNKFEITDYLGNVYPATIARLKFSRTGDRLDLCLLQATRMPYTPITVSERDLEWGETVWNINAGDGDFYPKTLKNPHGLIQVDVGHFSGYDKYMKRYVFKGLFVIPGASGSMIVNRDGHLVSIVTSFKMHSFFGKLNELSYGMSLNEIRKFLKGYL